MTKHLDTRERNFDLTVVTVTLNAGQELRRLADSLFQQEFKNFIWLVKDGGSLDDTEAIVFEYSKRMNVRFIKQCDTGIYSALNQAISFIDTSHYVVAGADDVFFQ